MERTCFYCDLREPETCSSFQVDRLGSIEIGIAKFAPRYLPIFLLYYKLLAFLPHRDMLLMFVIAETSSFILEKLSSINKESPERI